MELLLDTLKWSAAAGAAALVLRLLKPRLDRRYRPRWRYWVWLALAAILLLAPVQWESLIPAVEEYAPPVVVEVPQAAVHVSREAGVSLTAPVYTAPDVLDLAPTVRSGPAGDTPADAEAAPAGFTVPVETVLTILWLAGAAAFLLYHLTGSVWFSRRTRRYSRAAGEDVVRLCRETAGEMGLKKAPPIFICAAVDSPMVLGLLRPRLLLPTEDCGEQELGFILCHELTHYRRRDLWYKLLLLAANGLHWFNPLIYLLRREAEADLELTCDEAVVAGADRATRSAYGETLLLSLHRQSALSRSALTTHFYGGAGVMKRRMGNILGSPGRKRGAAALALILVLTLTAACSVGWKEKAPEGADWEPLAAEEQADWEEKLNSVELNGFVTRMYTDVRYLPLSDLFFDYQDPAALPEDAAARYEEAWGFQPYEDTWYAVTRETADAFLKEYTGYTFEDFAGGFGSQRIYCQEKDSWYFSHMGTTDTTAAVTGGKRAGDTILLDLEVSGGVYGVRSTGTMTIVDSKIQSFTNPLYAAVEAAAREIMENYCSILQSESESGLKIADSYINALYCYQSYDSGDKTYSVWNLEFRLKPDNISKVMFAGGMGEENGWITETQSMGSPVIIASQDGSGAVTIEETTYSGTVMESGYTWEEYIAGHLQYGLTLPGRLEGWPTFSTPFIVERLEGKNGWTTDRDEVVRRYLTGQGCEEIGEIATLQTFRVREEKEESAIVHAVCGDRTATMLLCYIYYPVESWNGVAFFWQVNSVLWDDGTAVVPNEDTALLQKTDFTLTQGKTARLHLYGRQLENGSWGVSQVELIWNENSGGTSFYTREAIVDQWGQDSLDYCTESWSEDGGLRTEDINFDGYADIGLDAWTTVSNHPCYFWLYDPETGKFDYAFCLNGPMTVDAENRQLICETKEGPGTYYTEYYRYLADGALYLAQRDTTVTDGVHSTTSTEYFEP